MFNKIFNFCEDHPISSILLIMAFVALAVYAGIATGVLPAAETPPEHQTLHQINLRIEKIEKLLEEQQLDSRPSHQE